MAKENRIRISDIVKLLGRRTKRDGNMIWYVPNARSSLYLEGDAKGILRATRLTD